MTDCVAQRTVDGFKSQFSRDFTYLPVWDNTKTYKTGDEVYYNVTGLFYKSLNDGVTSTPDTTADWEQFSDDIDNYVQDSDITKAFTESKFNFNPSLVNSSDCDDVLFVFYYLSAHYLVHDLRASKSGVSSSGSFSIESKSAGSVSVSYAIPDAYKQDPIKNFYTKTDYGLKYLNLVETGLVGNVVAVKGMSTP